MKNIISLAVFLHILCFAVAQSKTSFDSLTIRKLTKEEMQEDLKFLRRVIEETHPGLYRYTSKQAMNEKLERVAAIVKNSMSFYEYYGLLAGLVADIRCAHTYIIPKQELGSYMNEIKALPFEIVPVEKKLYITLNGTADTVIRPGFELLSINGLEAGKVLERLYRHIWADGYIQSSKKHKITGTAFPLFYYMMIAQPDSFLLKLKTPAGKIMSMKIAALPPAVYQAEFFKNPVNQQLLALYNERNKKDREEGWRLEFPADNVGLLRINYFGGGKNAEEAADRMRRFMEKNIDMLKEKKSQHLIVDLRNNGGGWDIQGVELFTYLMKDTTPVRYYHRKHAVTDSSEFLKFSDLSEEDKANIKKELVREADGTFTIKEEFNEDLKPQHAKSKRFTGNVYFLVNGGSGSTTSEFAAVAHSNRLGVFIGDETGGAYEGGNGGSFLHFQLPRSGIAVGSPLLFYNNGVHAPKLKGRGVIPDHTVRATIEDILTGRDAVLEYALKLIRLKLEP